MKRLAWIVAAASFAAAPPVTFETLKRAQEDPDTWISYGKNYAGWRYSPLSQIDTKTVAKLAPAWILQTDAKGSNESTPLVFDGVMYLTGPSNAAWAVDLLTGRKIWSYSKFAPSGLGLCCGPVNRGFAVLGDRLFKVNIQATLAALDLKSGHVLWETEIDDYRKGYTATAAPLAIKDMVVTGVAGGEWGIRGRVDAYDAATGTRRWRFYTIPAAGEPGAETWDRNSNSHGGGSTWITGTYDPELNLIYWGVGNPGPDMDGDDRGGDNLYSCSLVALDADTGKMKWYFQFTPHDVHDWDAVADPVLLDLTIGGRPVKAVVQANRNGFYYVLDRTNGKLLAAKAYTKINWADGIGPDGRPILTGRLDPTAEGTVVCPGLSGGHNWEATSYSPKTGLYYFGSSDGCEIFTQRKQEFVEGRQYQAGGSQRPPRELNGGSVNAVNPATGERKWRYEMLHRPAGLLATGGGLIFTGDTDGYLIALDANTGKVLWHFQAGAEIKAPPISYSLRGQQYIAIAAGSDVIAFHLQ